MNKNRVEMSVNKCGKLWKDKGEVAEHTKEHLIEYMKNKGEEFDFCHRITTYKKKRQHEEERE